MSVKPSARLKIYNTSDTLVDTITNADGLLSAEFTDEMTTGVGSFRFVVPGIQGFGNSYTTIGNHYKVTFELGYGGTYTHLFTGRITDFQTDVEDNMVTRTFTGKGLGEVLERYLIKNKRWQDRAAYLIFLDIASDLSLSYLMDVADGTEETLTINTITYFDLLKQISDYWSSGATQVKRDFGIDKDNTLYWRSRPFRTATTSITTGTADAGGNTTTTVDSALTQANDYWNGCYITYLTGDNAGLTRIVTHFDAATDTLTHQAFPNSCDAGDTYTMLGVETITNLQKYSLKYSIINSKNRLQVLGAATAPYPNDEDAFTAALSGTYRQKDWEWVANAGGDGTMSLETSSPKEGSNFVYCGYAAGGPGVDLHLDFQLSLDAILTTRTINSLRFWYFIVTDLYNPQVQILAPDDSNCFYMALTNTAGWHWFDQTIGTNNEYDADKNPDGWHLTGSPNWYNITGVRYGTDDTPAATPTGLGIDNLSFYPDRWSYADPAEDATNQTNYGIREAEYIDENLASDLEAQRRQETLLYQQKDRVLRLDFTVPGNTNIRLGDRLSITLPIDSLTSQAFDVVQTTHSFSTQGYFTKVSALNTTSTRRLPPLTPLESIQLNMKSTRDVVSSIYSRIVK